MAIQIHYYDINGEDASIVVRLNAVADCIPAINAIAAAGNHINEVRFI